MLLFCGNKILRSCDSINAIQISIGKEVKAECFNIEFNDKTSIIVPKGSTLELLEKNMTIDKAEGKCFYGTRSKFKLKFHEPEFLMSNLDPYIIGVAICTPVRNNSLQTKKKVLIEKNVIPGEYYSCNIKKSSSDYYQLLPEEGYPNLLRLELKKQENFKKLSDRKIPDKYLFSQKDQRINILRGCMDTLGHCVRGETSFETCSYQLSKDIAFLVRSLGGFAKIREKQSVRKYFIVSISFKEDFNPFLIKADSFKRSLKPRVKSILSVSSVGELPCVNVPLDFALLDNFVKVS